MPRVLAIAVNGKQQCLYVQTQIGAVMAFDSRHKSYLLEKWCQHSRVPG